MKKGLFVFLALLSLKTSKAQESALPKDILSNFIFTMDLNEKPALVTQKAIYRFENKWTKVSFKNIFTKKDSLAIYSPYEFSNRNFITTVLDNQIQFVLNGGGFVLSLGNNELKRIDNSVDQKNQFGGSHFMHNNQHHIYGGYGFWKFKDYITYFDKATGQWEYLNSESINPPQGRWKTLSQLIDNKLFVLGGRTSLKGVNNIDAPINSYFIYDFNFKKFENKRIFNPEIPIKFSNNNGFLFKNKKAYAKQGELVIVDFLKDEINQISSKALFKNIDNNYPVFVSQDTLYFIANQENKKSLSRLAVSELLKFKNKTHQIELVEKNKNFYFLIMTILITGFVFWLLFGLFKYKDFLKKLILFDENNLYFGKRSVKISLAQKKAITSLSQRGRLSSEELNKIVSSKNKFAKSHLTLLRQKFINDLNKSFKELTKTQVIYVTEFKDPTDKRFLIYRTTQEVLAKPSFLNFLLNR